MEFLLILQKRLVFWFCLVLELFKTRLRAAIWGESGFHPTIGDWDYIWLKACIPYYFCPWKPQDGRRKRKVGENAVLGLSNPELVRNACFYIELVSVTYDTTKEHNLQPLQTFARSKKTYSKWTFWKSSGWLDSNPGPQDHQSNTLNH